MNNVSKLGLLAALVITSFAGAAAAEIVTSEDATITGVRTVSNGNVWITWTGGTTCNEIKVVEVPANSPNKDANIKLATAAMLSGHSVDIFANKVTGMATGEYCELKGLELLSSH